MRKRRGSNKCSNGKEGRTDKWQGGGDEKEDRFELRFIICWLLLQPFLVEFPLTLGSRPYNSCTHLLLLKGMSIKVQMEVCVSWRLVEM